MSNNIDNRKTIFDDDILKVPFDIVKLPSESKLYGGIVPESLEVSYTTTEDEDTLYSDTIVDDLNVFDVLVRDKIKDKSVNVDNLLLGDYNQILMFLRKTAFGKLYHTNLIDPDTSKIVRFPVDIDQLRRKPIGAEFNEKGEFEFVLKNMQKSITFKLLTVGMSNLINKTAQQNKKANGVVPYLVTRLTTQITSVGGITDKTFIGKFAAVINPDDRLDFMTYVDKISPGVDLNFEFESTIKKTKFTDKVILGLDFFYPKSPITTF